MNKFTAILGILLASFVLYKFNVGTYGLNDAFRVVDVVAEESSMENDLKALFVYPAQDSSELEVLLQKYTKSSSPETIIVLGENSSWRGNFSALTDESSFKKLAEFKDFKISYSKNPLELSVEFNNSLNSIKAAFPKANVIPLLIKDIASNEEMEKLAATIEDFGAEDVLLVAILPFTENMPGDIANFHDELSENAMMNIDLSAVAQMDVSNRPIVYALFNYVKLLGAEKVEIDKHVVEENSSGFFAAFYEGDPSLVNRKFTILATGDVMLGRYVRTLMDESGMDYPFENISGYQHRFFEGADLVIANLEGPIKGKGRSGGTSMVFAFNEDVAPLLKNYGFNLLSLANNHAMDQGGSGRTTTIEALEASELGWCGNPSDEDEDSVYYGEVGVKKYAVICFQDVTSKIDDDQALKLISKVNESVDYLLVYVHWGYEYKKTANDALQVKPGRAFIDAGADMVIGHHPHVIENFELYNGKLIFYSLGNFIFDQYWSSDTQEGLALGVVLDDSDTVSGLSGLKSKVYLFPLKSELSKPRLMTEKEKNLWYQDFIKHGDYDEKMKSAIKNGLSEVEVGAEL